MVRIGDVWDRTLDVLRGRAGILAGIALLTFVLPGIVNGAFRSVVTPGSGLAMLGPVIVIGTILLLIYGFLAVTAVASDPAVDRASAFAIAGQRLLPALGVLAIVLLISLALFVPAIALMVAAGVRMNAAGGVEVPAGATGTLAGSGLAMLVALVAGLWLSARLVPLFGVIVNERRGLGALRRTLQLTRGSTLKLIGVMILYAIVVVVLMMAATSVVGVVARLLLGAEANAAVAMVLATVSALISAATSVLQSVFYARFWVAAHDREQRMAPLA